MKRTEQGLLCAPRESHGSQGGEQGEVCTQTRVPRKPCETETERTAPQLCARDPQGEVRTQTRPEQVGAQLPSLEPEAAETRGSGTARSRCWKMKWQPRTLRVKALPFKNEGEMKTFPA